MSKAKTGTFDDLLAITEESLRVVTAALREIILEVDPSACEVVRLGDRTATYGVGHRKMKDGYAYILPHKSWINLGFYQGVDLMDSEGLLEGIGAKMRHVKIRSPEDARLPAIRDLIRSALELRKTSGG